MKISQRARHIPPFYAMEFGKHAAELEQQGHPVIRLSLGEPDFGAPPAVSAALRNLMDGRPLPYTAALGLPALREAVAGFYQQAHGVRLPASRVVITAGASAALLLAAAALVDPGDEIIVGDPSYPCNRQFLHAFGARVRLVPTQASSRFQLDPDTVRANWTAETRGLMIATPSNPTGTSIEASALVSICDWARQHDAWRIIDEIYLNLADHDSTGRPPPSVLSHDPDAVVINSFSKYFGMTGWRLGWCVVPEALVPAMERLAQNYYICPPTPAQHAALACFSAESLAICEQRRRIFAERRQLVLSALADIGLPVPARPDGAFYVYFDVGPTGLDAWTFCQRALHEAHLAMTPGKDFGPCTAERHVRLSCATDTAALQQAMVRLADFVTRLRRSAP